VGPIAYRWDETRDGGGYFHHWTTKPGKIDHVDVSSLACTLIRRKVLEDARRPPFRFTMGDQWGIAGLGEDFYFCEGVREKGYRIWVDYSIVAHHFKIQDTRMINDTLIAELEAMRWGVNDADTRDTGE